MPAIYNNWLSALVAIISIFALNEYYPKAARVILLFMLLVLVFNNYDKLENMLTGR